MQNAVERIFREIDQLSHDSQEMLCERLNNKLNPCPEPDQENLEIIKQRYAEHRAGRTSFVNSQEVTLQAQAVLQE